MRSQRYALHVQADKVKTTLKEWEDYCNMLRCKGVDTEDEDVFSHGFGDCYMTDLIYEQAVSIIRATCSAGVKVTDIATDNGDGEPMDWVFRADEFDRSPTTGTILDTFEEYNTALLEGDIDGYPADDEDEDDCESEDDAEDDIEDLEGE